MDILDYILTYESNNVRRVGSSYRLKDHKSLAITNGKWFWHSRGIGGKNPIDFLTEVRGYSLVEAVCTLLGENPHEYPNKASGNSPAKSITPKAKPPPQIHEPVITAPQQHFEPSVIVPPEPPPFALPVRNKDNRRVIAYLQSRGIDKELILDCINRGVLYESVTFHNTVFIGKDENGKTRYAAMRGTMSNFKCDADGSDKRYGFLLPPSDPDSFEVAVFESPIDCLSHQTLCKQDFLPPFDGWRLSLGGTSLLSLTHFLENHKNVTHCLICTDNDEAGEKAAAKITELPDVTSQRILPGSFNDWNDALLAIQKENRISDRSNKNDTPGSHEGR